MPRGKKKAVKAAETDLIDDTPTAAMELAAGVTMADGRQVLRAIGYALKACPAGDEQVALAHVVFIDRLVVCSDGERWHAGVLPAAVRVPFVAPRAAVKELMIHMAYADRIARSRSAQWMLGIDTRIADAIHESGERECVVTIDCATLPKMVFKLAGCEVGYVPDTWIQPVSATAAAVEATADLPLRCGHFKEAMQWYRAWDKDHGVFQQRVDDRGVLRIDIASGGHLVALAFLMPEQLPPARLVADEPLFAKLHAGRKVGQSILDLQIDGGDGAPYKKAEAGEDGAGDPAEEDEEGSEDIGDEDYDTDDTGASD